ncbi:hypothetical protein EBR43_01135 [bacterium]|jgi:hypothetical protein|nr:hypothetical protein [bacterium]NBX71868.1 hypothetical protein [bacterium]
MLLKIGQLHALINLDISTLGQSKVKRHFLADFKNQFINFIQDKRCFSQEKTIMNTSADLFNQKLYLQSG